MMVIFTIFMVWATITAILFAHDAFFAVWDYLRGKPNYGLDVRVEFFGLTTIVSMYSVLLYAYVKALLS